MCQETRQRPSQSKSIATNSSYENSNAINCNINAQFQSPQVSEKSRHRQCFSWPYSRDALESRPTSAIACERSSSQRPQMHTPVHLRLYSSQPSEVHLQRISTGLRNAHNSHRCKSPTLAGIAITFYGTRWSYLRYGCCVEFQQRLCKDSTMITDTITDMITGIMVYLQAEFKILKQRSLILWLLRKGSLITP